MNPRTASPTSTDTWKCVADEWAKLTATPGWKRRLDSELRQAGINQPATEIVQVVNSLHGPNSYRPLSERVLLGRLVCASAEFGLVMRVSMQAALFSLTPRWASLKFRSGADIETSVASYATFTFMELSKRQDRSKQRDPLACVRLNATNRAVSAMMTYTKSPREGERVLPFDDELESLVEGVADQESFDFMVDSWSKASGLDSTDVALTVLHDSFGLSFEDLAKRTEFSRATIHRKVSTGRKRFRERLDAVA